MKEHHQYLKQRRGIFEFFVLGCPLQLQNVIPKIALLTDSRIFFFIKPFCFEL